MSDLRRPTEDEQKVIVGVSKALSDLARAKTARVIALGMGPLVIEDSERGRWTSLLGLPVIELKGLDYDVVALLVEVDL